VDENIRHKMNHGQLPPGRIVNAAWTVSQLWQKPSKCQHGLAGMLQ